MPLQLSSKPSSTPSLPPQASACAYRNTPVRDVLRPVPKHKVCSRCQSANIRQLLSVVGLGDLCRVWVWGLNAEIWMLV